MSFNNFQIAVQRQFNEMKKHELFRVNVDTDKLWELYLKSFPEGTNPMFRVRTQHDCQCCRRFVRNAGDMVAIVEGKLVSIWDVKVEGFFQVVADALSAFIKTHAIENVFLHFERTVGTDRNFQETEAGILTWTHFFLQLPNNLVEKKIDLPSKLGAIKTTQEMMLRALKEITIDSMETVLELIAQNSLYRGAEHKFAVEKFLELKKEFDKVPVDKQDIFCWSMLKPTPISVARIRNSVIGTLLVDLSTGDKDLDTAVKSFETKVAPTNYKRPTALVTKAMVESAKQKLEELGFTSALERRFAVLEDISINNVLFADRAAKKVLTTVFDSIASALPDAKLNLDKVEEVSIDNFLANVLPKAESVEVFFENCHAGNLVSLIAPVDLTSKTMFKWPNNFSWSYAGELTDSIKERVKSAGGKVDGDLRCSLSWFNFDDLDLRITEPNGNIIYYGNKVSYATGGNLDVDMNAGSGKTRNAVENICYPARRNMIEGVYKLQVHQFSRRENVDVGFDVEIEFDSKIFTFNYDKLVKADQIVNVAEIKYTHRNGFEILTSLPSTQAVRDYWNIKTYNFHKVSVIMKSPNHWDEKQVGNKHFFFMLDNCVNDTSARGFFNEFLCEELNTHRKVFEVVGSKMKVDKSPNQLSGLGFSSTQRSHLICKVNGKFSRIIKIIF